MSGHTPGPWVQFVDLGKCAAIMPAGRFGDVAAFSVSPKDADARLMAAAPELLEALGRVLEVALDLPGVGAGEIVRLAEAALKKARGE